MILIFKKLRFLNGLLITVYTLGREAKVELENYHVRFLLPAKNGGSKALCLTVTHTSLCCYNCFTLSVYRKSEKICVPLTKLRYGVPVLLCVKSYNNSCNE